MKRIVAVAILAVLAGGPVRGQDEASPVADALRRADESVRAILEVPGGKRTFRNTVEALDDIVARLETDTNMIQFLAHVSTERSEREAGRRAEKDVANWLVELAANEGLYRALQAFADTRPRLDAVERRLLEHTLRDYRRAGMALPAEQREQLKAIQKRINELSVEFDTNINEEDARVPLTRQELSGLPEDWFEQLEPYRIGDVYLVGMAAPEAMPVLDFCDDGTTRRKLWIIYKRRGGEKNVALLEEILKLRAQAAALLGYAHAADYENEVRMTKNAATVMSFYEKLRPLVRAKADKDYAQLFEAKRAQVGPGADKLYPWDATYYTNRLLQERYAVDPEQVRQYFPLDRVIAGLFEITQSLYSITYRDVTAEARSRGRDLWHEDVQLFEVWDNQSNALLGEFYLDLHPRPDKYGHAAQWGLLQHKRWADGTVTRPLAALVCNFTKPTSERPSLLRHQEVETFFHEFGHCLHTILSESRFWRFSGTNVERDFAEAPSQMFENWVWDAEVLATFARHYRTGEPLPASLLESMLAARNLSSGLLAERQFFYGLFDMRCHLDPRGELDTTRLAHDLWSSPEHVELYEPVPATFFHAAFGHLTGYQAGYYGYQWSLVYACDMAEHFKSMGMLDAAAGRLYRGKILARGGTLDGLDLVKDYLGREPDMAAYLRHLGLDGD